MIMSDIFWLFLYHWKQEWILYQNCTNCFTST